MEDFIKVTTVPCGRRLPHIFLRIIEELLHSGSLPLYAHSFFFMNSFLKGKNQSPPTSPAAFASGLRTPCTHYTGQEAAWLRGPTREQSGPGLPQAPAPLLPLHTGDQTQRHEEKTACYQLQCSHHQLHALELARPGFGVLSFFICDMNISDLLVAELLGSSKSP